MKNLVLTLLISAVLVACSSGEDNSLDGKRNVLTEKKKEFSKLKDEIEKLEKEISELDTTVKDIGIAVMVDTIKRGTYSNPFTFQGLVASDMNVMISPEVPSVIQRIHVKEGQRIYKGQVLASLDGRAAQSQIAELEANLRLAKVNYEKQERLWKQNIGSEIQYLSAKTQYESLQKRLQNAQVQLGKYSLRSPMNGTVDEIMANEGQLVGSLGGPSGVMRVVNLSDIEIKANVSESYLPAMSRGQEVEVFYPSLNLTVKEKITAIGNVIDVDNRTFTIVIKPKNKSKLLKPNLLAMITSSDYVKENSIAVPTKLIRNDGKGNYVLTVNSSTRLVEKTSVEIDKQFAKNTVLKGGLEEGSLLIVEGYNAVISGDLSKIVSSKN